MMTSKFQNIDAIQITNIHVFIMKATNLNAHASDKLTAK